MARTSCQIYNDASLVVYYPFDTNDTYNDYGVNLCNGVASGTTTISNGRVGEAILFTSSGSYFLAQCYPKMRENDLSYSFSLWINPTSTTSGGSLVHISSNSDGTGNCIDVLALTGTGDLVCQWMKSTTNVDSVQGPVIPANTWTHIAVVYGSFSGVRLFINGQFSASSSETGSMSLENFLNPRYITLGNIGSSVSSISVSCINGSIPISSGYFPGAIDEFRLYNRELDSQEICVLANP